MWFCEIESEDFVWSQVSQITGRLVLKKTFSAWASTLNMGLPTKIDIVCFLPVGYALTKGYLKLETSAKHHIPQAKNIPY